MNAYDKEQSMNVGVIGLGAMGAGMAHNFYEAGVLHRIWNRSTEKAKDFTAETGVPYTTSPEELAKECDLVVTCVSRDADVLEMVQAISTSIQKNSIVVDTSTVSVTTAKQAASILERVDTHFLDCPVSGGVEGAKNGTLAMMVGGANTVLEQVRPSLNAIAKNIVYIGSTGSGQAAKAVNQIMVAGINQAVTEALAFGDAMELDMDKVVDVVSTGAAANWFLSHRGNTMLAGKYDSGFKLSLHYKDLSICKNIVHTISEHELPIIEATLASYQTLMEQGYGDEDISALFRLKKKTLSQQTQ